MDEIKVLLKIIRNFLQEEKEYDFLEDFDEEKLYHLAKKHKMSNFLMDWSKKNCKSKEIKLKIEMDFNQQLMKDTNESVEFRQILDKFEEANIKTLVFKGFLMKEVYPQSYMRQMSDVDLLAAPNDFKEAVNLMKILGFAKTEDSEHHLVLAKKPFMVVELHRKLICR